jgi:hypothetical protein
MNIPRKGKEVMYGSVQSFMKHTVSKHGIRGLFVGLPAAVVGIVSLFLNLCLDLNLSSFTSFIYRCRTWALTLLSMMLPKVYFLQMRNKQTQRRQLYF